MPLTGQAKRDYQLAWIKKRRDAWIKENGPCAHCGSSKDPHVDHVDPKSKLLNPAGIWGLTAARRSVELAKCQVLCRPCHEAKSAAEARSLPPHGTKARYSRKDEYRCRCGLCRTAAARYERERRRALK